MFAMLFHGSAELAVARPPHLVHEDERVTPTISDPTARTSNSCDLRDRSSYSAAMAEEPRPAASEEWQPATSEPGEVFTPEGQVASAGAFARGLKRRDPRGRTVPSLDGGRRADLCRGLRRDRAHRRRRRLRRRRHRTGRAVQRAGRRVMRCVRRAHNQWTSASWMSRCVTSHDAGGTCARHDTTMRSATASGQRNIAGSLAPSTTRSSQ